MKKSILTVAFMVVITIVFISALASINELSRERIIQNKEIEKYKSILYAFNIFPPGVDEAMMSPTSSTADIKWENQMLLDVNWRSFNWFTPIIKYPNLTSEQLKYYIDKAYHEVPFFKNPMKRIIRTYQARGGDFFLRRVLRWEFIKTALPSIKNMITRLLKG